jgi:hypothetical protein
MVAHLDDFCKGVAMVLQGESLKALCYVPHGASLGSLREQMVRTFVRHETPEKYRVETGLVRNHDTGASSRQCDLLIHDPKETPPLYRWEDFVVIHAFAARAVVEVKSDLCSDTFTDLLRVHESLISLQSPTFIPTFGYGLTGVTFTSCVKYIQDAVSVNRLNRGNAEKHQNWPTCFAIQNRHCIGVCPADGIGGALPAFCIVDLTQADDSAYTADGIETGFFLQIYSEALQQRRQAFAPATVYSWFNALPIRPDGKAWVTPDGTVTQGNISFEG